jgi:hypothetical protein
VLSYVQASAQHQVYFTILSHAKRKWLCSTLPAAQHPLALLTNFFLNKFLVNFHRFNSATCRRSCACMRPT